MKFQSRVWLWMHECFGGAVSADKVERHHRFLEESLELVQSTGCTKQEALQLVDYVFGRPAGAPVKELGGVMVTLAALAEANALDMDAAAEMELQRISTPEFIARNRHKNATKPQGSPLPGVAPASEVLSGCAVRAELQRIALDDWRNGPNVTDPRAPLRVEYDDGEHPSQSR